MKKILAILVMVLFAAYPAVSQASSAKSAPVEVSGTIVLQHIISSDTYATHGDDNTDAYKVYLNFDKQITDGIKAHVIVNADKFGSQGDVGSDSSALEEAYILFTGIGGNDIAAIFGKMEAPFGQDYSQFITSTFTHHYLEIDKIWGAGVVFGIEGIGSLTAAVANRADLETRDVALTDTTAFKIKADKLMDGLSLEASMLTLGSEAAEHGDQVQTSIAGKYSVNDLTVAAERSVVKDYGFADVDDMTVTIVSADYKIGNILLKANHENIDNDHASGHHEDVVTMYGANYEFTDGVYATVEASNISYETGHGDDKDQVLLGLSAHF